MGREERVHWSREEGADVERSQERTSREREFVEEEEIRREEVFRDEEWQEEGEEILIEGVEVQRRRIEEANRERSARGSREER